MRNYDCTSFYLPAVEVEALKATLPNVVMSIREEKYEHLDTMWADTAKDTVFPRVSEEHPTSAD